MSLLLSNVQLTFIWNLFCKIKKRKKKKQQEVVNKIETQFNYKTYGHKLSFLKCHFICLSVKLCVSVCLLERTSVRLSIHPSCCNSAFMGGIEYAATNQLTNDMLPYYDMLSLSEIFFFFHFSCLLQFYISFWSIYVYIFVVVVVIVFFFNMLQLCLRCCSFVFLICISDISCFDQKVTNI